MILPKANPINLEVATDYAKELLGQYPNFKPTRSLYLDLEGSGGGNEQILSLYWPQLRSERRFTMLWRGREEMNREALIAALEKLKCNPKTLDHVVVFSGGVGNKEKPQEQGRFEKVFGEKILPQRGWVNMHLGKKRVPSVSNYFRKQSKWSKPEKNESIYPFNLENLEHLFGYERPPGQRDHKNEYQDGKPGEMKVLELERQAHAVKSLVEFPNLIKYCEWDVQSMFRIARWCEGQI